MPTPSKEGAGIQVFIYWTPACAGVTVLRLPFDCTIFLNSYYCRGFPCGGRNDVSSAYFFRAETSQPAIPSFPRRHSYAEGVSQFAKSRHSHFPLTSFLRRQESRKALDTPSQLLAEAGLSQSASNPIRCPA